MEHTLWQAFDSLDIRVGEIIEAKVLEKARKPAYQLWIDFGDTLGIRKSSAQITKLYSAEALVGKQILAVVNFPPKQITHFMSECLVLGLLGEAEEVILIQPDRKVKNGLRLR